MREWCVYILRCADGTLYTGCTSNLGRRIMQHNGELRGGARYTSGRRPCELLASFPARDRGDAQSLEAAVKAMTREEKLALSEGRAHLRRCTRQPTPTQKHNKVKT